MNGTSGNWLSGLTASSSTPESVLSTTKVTSESGSPLITLDTLRWWRSWRTRPLTSRMRSPTFMRPSRAALPCGLRPQMKTLMRERSLCPARLMPSPVVPLLRHT